jgi:hypothetical protein
MDSPTVSQAAGYLVVEQPELLYMELLIVFLMALSLHIVTDRGLTPMLPNRTDVVAIASQFASPQLFLDRWDTGEDLTGRDAFDDPYNFGWTKRSESIG